MHTLASDFIGDRKRHSNSLASYMDFSTLATSFVEKSNETNGSSKTTSTVENLLLYIPKFDEGIRHQEQLIEELQQKKIILAFELFDFQKMLETAIADQAAQQAAERAAQNSRSNGRR